MIERKRGDCLIIMNTTTIEQACDPSNWRWKRWDVRADGKVFWQYKTLKNGQNWVDWDKALSLKNKQNERSWTRYQLKRKNKSKKIKEHTNTKEKNQIKKAKINEYYRKRRATDEIFSIQYRTRRRISDFIKKGGYSKPSKTQEMLGCDWSHLKTHLESKFTDGMSWENRSMWHVDHIIPLASAKSIEEVVRLCYYTNLQPLWAEDNLKKGATI